MKLWVDIQLPPSLCGWLLAAFGVESSHVQDIGLHEADDADVFASLRREGEVVFTKDEGFIDVATRLGAPPQILWLRVGNCGNDDLRSFLSVGLPGALDALRRGDPVVELRRVRPGVTIIEGNIAGPGITGGGSLCSCLSTFYSWGRRPRLPLPGFPPVFLSTLALNNGHTRSALKRAS